MGSLFATKVRRLSRPLDDEVDDVFPETSRSNQMVVGAADDPAERRADHVADQAMRRIMSEPSGGPHWKPAGATRIRRSHSPSIGLAGGQVDSQLDGDIRRRMGGGRPLDQSLQDTAQRTIGGDFSDVRVHTGGGADQIARRIEAKAFTVGRDVFFAEGQFRPDTKDGMHTFLHESSHLAENEGRVQRAVVRRLIPTKPKDISSSRSVSSKIGTKLGTSGGSEMHMLAKILGWYHDGTAKTRPGSVDLIIRYCEDILAKPAGKMSKHDAKKRSKVEDLLAEALTERGRLQAQDIYTQAAYSKPDAAKPGTSGLWNQTDMNWSDASPEGVYQVHKGAKALAAGKAEDNSRGGMGGFDQAALDEVRKYKLTEAEILAIRTYTAGDYGYINPAAISHKQTNIDVAAQTNPLSSNKKVDPTREELGDVAAAGWWEGKLGSKSGPAKDQLRIEGAMHAGVAMQGLAKLPKVAATTYRGQDYPEVFVDADLREGAKLKWSIFSSTSVLRRKGVQFAGGKNPVLFEITVTNGRDLQRLSVFGATEGEILLLPGTELIVTSVEKKPGDSFTTVQVTQTK